MALPIRLGVLRALVKEISASGQAGKPLVVLARRPAEQVDEHGRTFRVVVRSHRARVRAATELPPQYLRELSRTADDERLPCLAGGGDLLHEPAQHTEADRQSHQRRRDEREAR
ncbi:MAG: hypothetical protein QOD48_1987, partial [Gaiellaceae bacterium]|nr:hypothetical protein [Gaiellaceae bacterium]